MTSKADDVRAEQEKRNEFVRRELLKDSAFRFKIKILNFLFEKHSLEILSGAFTPEYIVGVINRLEAEILKTDEMFFNKFYTVDNKDGNKGTLFS